MRRRHRRRQRDVKAEAVMAVACAALAADHEFDVGHEGRRDA
jgi:hypothetical protein